jgi:hypothetical protein
MEEENNTQAAVYIHIHLPSSGILNLYMRGVQRYYCLISLA